MAHDLATLRVDIEIENPARPGEKRLLRSVLVDTGAELSWVPSELLESLGVKRNNQWRFRQADGTVLERWTGTVVVHLEGKRVGDEVVFGQPGTRERSSERARSRLLASSRSLRETMPTTRSGDHAAVSGGFMQGKGR